MAIDFSQILKKVEDVHLLAKVGGMGDECVYEKLKYIKPLCENRLKSIYANILTPNDINLLQNNFDNLISYVQNYKAGNSAYLPHIFSTVDTIYSTMAKIPLVGKGETSAILTEVVDDFKQKNSTIIADITKGKDDLIVEMATLKQAVQTLSDEIVAKKSEVTSLTIEFQKQFSTAQDKRSIDFADAQKERVDEFTHNESERDTQFKAQTNKIANEADATLKQIEKIKYKVDDIYGIIGKASIAGTQKTYADKAKTMAHFLQLASIVFMLISIVVLFFYIQGQLETMTWPKFIYRFTMSSIFLLPAFFLANEAKKQREKEKRYRELEIKMAAITPYFLEIGNGPSKDNENLSEKDMVKLELAKKLLAPDEYVTDKNVVLPPEIVEILNGLMNIAEKNK